MTFNPLTLGNKLILRNMLRTLFKQEHIKKWQLVFWLNGLLLLYLTLMPSIDSGLSYPHADKLFHFIGFGAFALFCGLAFRQLNYLWVILIASSLGVIVEIAQSFLPHRGFSYADMLADLIGIIAAVIVLHLSGLRRKTKNSDE